MKFIKEHLVLVVGAAVAVISVLLAIFVVGGWMKTWLDTDVKQHYTGEKSNIDQMLATHIAIPGTEYASTGIPTANWVDAKKKAMEYMAAESRQVTQIGAEANRIRRVVNDKGTIVPLLEGKPEPLYLPKLRAENTFAFKEDYNAIFQKWRLRLQLNRETPAATPPSQQELTDAKAKRDLAMAGPGAAAPAAAMGGGMMMGGADSKADLDFYRKQIMNRAGAIIMYVDDSALPPRGNWRDSAVPPTEQDIFESLLDSWFKSDVVNAIAQVNDDVQKTNTDKNKANVGLSPIKRLMRVTVGNDARISRLGTFSGASAAGGEGPVTVGGSTGGLFVVPGMLIYEALDARTGGAGTGEGGGGAQTSATTNDPNKPNPLLSMTGRSSGADYDVVLMQVCMDIDPAYLNKFIEQLYKQNMGYTVLDLQWRTVDPIDRISNGYIYGDTQVIEVQILVEGLLFRNWTQPLMPDATRAQLAIPQDTPKQ